MFEPDHNPFIKQVNCVNLNMTQTNLTSTHNLFINGLIMLDSRILSNLATLTHWLQPRLASCLK